MKTLHELVADKLERADAAALPEGTVESRPEGRAPAVDGFSRPYICAIWQQHKYKCKDELA